MMHPLSLNSQLMVKKQVVSHCHDETPLSLDDNSFGSSVIYHVGYTLQLPWINNGLFSFDCKEKRKEKAIPEMLLGLKERKHVINTYRSCVSRLF